MRNRRSLIFAAFLALFPHNVSADPTQGQVVTTGAQKALYDGQEFFSGSAATSVLVNQAFRYLVKNPAGSNKTCYVYRIDAYSSVAFPMRVLFDPTTNLPTTARPLTVTLLGSPNVPVCQIFADVGTAAESGGTDTGVDFFMPSGERDVDANFVGIAPGHAVGFTSTPAITAVTANVAMYEREF